MLSKEVPTKEMIKKNGLNTIHGTIVLRNKLKLKGMASVVRIDTYL